MRFVNRRRPGFAEGSGSQTAEVPFVRDQSGAIDVERTADAMERAQIAAGAWPWYLRPLLRRSNRRMTRELLRHVDEQERDT